MALSEEEKLALIRVLGKKFLDFCEGKEPKLSLSYHKVRGYEYPALVIHCGGKRKKIHINQAEWQAYVEERERLKLKKILKVVKQLENLKLRKGNAEFLLGVLKELEEKVYNRKIWEFLFANRELLPKGTFPYWRFEDDLKSVEVWEVPALRELKLVLIQKDPIRGEVKRHETISYLCKEGKTYILSVEPLRILKVLDQGVEINNRWIIRETDKGLFVDLDRI